MRPAALDATGATTRRSETLQATAAAALALAVAAAVAVAIAAARATVSITAAAVASWASGPSRLAAATAKSSAWTRPNHASASF